MRTEAEDIESFLTALRADGADPGFLGVLLPWTSATGGALYGPLCKALEIIRSDAPLRERARRVGNILAQVIALDARSFSRGEYGNVHVWRRASL
jgi:hypothetical protein